MMVSARNDRKTPLPATWNKKAAPGPPPPPPPPRGTHTRSPPRRAVPPAASATPPGRGGASTVDIEALPGELHEQVFQAGPRRVEAGHRNAGQHQGAVHRFRRVLADLRADLAVAGPDVRESQRFQHAQR